MKRFLTVMIALVITGAALSAQEKETSAQTSRTDTLVVIVRHDNSGNTFFEKVGKPFKKGYKAVEDGVVSGYQAVEDAFVKPFADTVSTSIMYRNGYRADVELSWSNPMTWGIKSSHGYSFGNGLYVGVGTGFTAEFAKESENPTYLVPAFADIKYSFINMLASPYISCMIGGYADVTNTGVRTFTNPALGLDLGRFSIEVGYEYQFGFWGHLYGEHMHQIRCGLGFTF